MRSCCWRCQCARSLGSGLYVLTRALFPGSVLYGIAFALGYYAYYHLRHHELAIKYLRKPEPIERTFVFSVLFVLTYTTSVDDVNTPCESCPILRTPRPLIALSFLMCDRRRADRILRGNVHGYGHAGAAARGC